MTENKVPSAEYFMTIESGAMAEFRDKGSRFLAYTFPLADQSAFKEKLAELKKEHPKATHHCFAYRIGLTGDQWRVSDDGEPSGTAGRPILGQIDSKQLTNMGIVVVRYFGGSLLGVPGLIAAYKSAAAMALQVTQFVQKPVLAGYTIQFDYTQMNEVMKVIKQFDCVVMKQETQLFCIIEAGVPKNRQDEVIFKIREIRGAEITPLG
ncbi:MAG: YigZ family protein [Chitinophagaceae bacterium]|nr:MAG: YigZ family protein [Chitinophagaceae bacterium]